MENKGNSCFFYIPLFPKILEESVPKANSLEEITYVYSQSRVTTPKGALKDFRKVNKIYRDLCKSGDKRAVLELLEKVPPFVYVPWVKRTGLRSGIKRGRKWGSTQIARSVIMALVDALESKSKEGAFIFLSEKMISSEGKKYSYERIKALYYDSLKSPRYVPLLIVSKPSKDTDESVGFGGFICKFKNDMQKGVLYHPETLADSVIQIYGSEKLKEVMSIYIEEAERFLNQKIDDKVKNAAKKILKDNKFIELAKSLMT
jgi:hypothetical protein